MGDTDRYEYYKGRPGVSFSEEVGDLRGRKRGRPRREVVILQVTTCLCCRVDGCQDAWLFEHGRATHVGVGVFSLRKDYILITEAEARKLAPLLFVWGKGETEEPLDSAPALR